LGSTSPVLLGGQVIAQGGKDAQIRLLNLATIAGATPHVGNEAQSVPTPSNNLLFTAPAVWRNARVTWMFGADGGGTAAWTFTNGQLIRAWSNSTAGTSPAVAGGLLYVYNPSGALNIYRTTNGAPVASLTCGPGHWNSPIVVDGRIALPEGNANEHATAGVLNIWAFTQAQ
jgi:hypothetical protein